MCSILQKLPWILSRMWIPWGLGGIFCMYLLSPLDVWYHLIYDIILMSFCQFLCPLEKVVYWNQLTLIGWCYSLSLILLSSLFVKIDPSEFSAHMFKIVIYSYLTVPLIRVGFPCLSHLLGFHLKSTLSYIKTVTSAYFLVPFDCNILLIISLKGSAYL